MDYTNLPKTVVEKFLLSTKKGNVCWEWTGSTTPKGVPRIQLKHNGEWKIYSAYRISLSLADRYLPLDKPVVRTCETISCVNPNHLVSGDESRFWSKVSKLSDGCWPWIGLLDRDMYGIIRVDGTNVGAHVYSWELHNNRQVVTGMVVMHSCDHPYCVNPNHLSIGTPADNVLDRDQKGRANPVHGASHYSTELTEEKVIEARNLYKLGTKNVQLAHLYGVSESTMHAILHRKTWRHI